MLREIVALRASANAGASDRQVGTDLPGSCRIRRD